MSYGSIMKRLQRLEFPDCTREALEFITETFSSQEGAAIPGLGGDKEPILAEVCQAFVLFGSKRSTKKLSALQELQLLQLLCEHFRTALEKTKYQIFNLMFGARGDEQANTLLTKLVSMALSVSCTSVLDCAAIWMQDRNSHSSDSLQLTKQLVEDYCLLFPDPSNMFQKLPSISPLFVCNFTTSVTSVFPFHDVESIPPASLLEHVTTWITSDCTLCCESVRQVAIHGTCSSPVPGLLGWCVLGPIICSHLMKPGSSAASASNKPHSQMYKPSVTKTMTTLSKLHLGLLQSLDFCQSSSLSHCLLSVTDAMCLVKQLSTLLDRVRESQSDSGVKVEEDEVTHITLERSASRTRKGSQKALASQQHIISQAAVSQIDNFYSFAATGI
ncbi:hypothetical protein C0Q70_00866 [Pomacea canaliculata]|uniref:Uncharacterized protein n=1 Tax=Pomacea canaliculata TaxID=400727 RepID=A0A2T7PXV0_POMCA|nr:hypothetical protein C0Q70_00866 [Pomacea canaliculata]